VLGRPGLPLRRPSGTLRLVRTWVCVVLLAGCAARTPATQGHIHRVPGVWHRVDSGQTLVGIAARYGAAIEDLEEINGVDRRDHLAAGRRLFVPTAGAAGKRHESAARRNSTSQRVRFIWPVPGGRLSSPFGKRDGRMHEGIDIAAAQGTPIVAAAAGEVLYSGDGIRGYGNLVMIRHAGDMVTVYAHNRRNHVREGQKVRQGEVIAEVGKTGRATGYHVHFEVRAGEQVRDPRRYVSPD
jgi:murein DD-endopeptidase MepM/ murein hydrolase activator NlpD